jgi:hypothetical protein
MKNRMIKLGYALAISLTPAAALAATDQDALEACMDALTQELATSHGSPMAASLSATAKASGERLRRSQIFHLDARSTESQEVVARIDCIVDPRARVRSLNRLPLDAGDADERATTKFF